MSEWRGSIRKSKGAGKWDGEMHGKGLYLPPEFFPRTSAHTGGETQLKGGSAKKLSLHVIMLLTKTGNNRIFLIALIHSDLSMTKIYNFVVSIVRLTMEGRWGTTVTVLRLLTLCQNHFRSRNM